MLNNVRKARNLKISKNILERLWIQNYMWYQAQGILYIGSLSYKINKIEVSKVKSKERETSGQKRQETWELYITDTP